MDVRFTEIFGQVRATDAVAGKAVPKVYARLADGSVKFHKDGYTDLRGRFDYASVNTPERQAIQRVVVLAFVTISSVTSSKTPLWATPFLNLQYPEAARQAVRRPLRRRGIPVTAGRWQVRCRLHRPPHRTETTMSDTARSQGIG
ncbi:MAG TPA: hypothetical protein VMZ71_17495 [Gemmataceae bacterium]|nr:hypothetical protein [Gemmataceae bacterium]